MTTGCGVTVRWEDTVADRVVAPAGPSSAGRPVGDGFVRHEPEIERRRFARVEIGASAGYAVTRAGDVLLSEAPSACYRDRAMPRKARRVPRDHREPVDPQHLLSKQIDWINRPERSGYISWSMSSAWSASPKASAGTCSSKHETRWSGMRWTIGNRPMSPLFRRQLSDDSRRKG